MRWPRLGGAGANREPTATPDGIDRSHLSPQAFEGLAQANRAVRRPDCTLVTVDHNVPTFSRKSFQSIESFIKNEQSRAQVRATNESRHSAAHAPRCIFVQRADPRALRSPLHPWTLLFLRR